MLTDQLYLELSSQVIRRISDFYSFTLLATTPCPLFSAPVEKQVKVLDLFNKDCVLVSKFKPYTYIAKRLLFLPSNLILAKLSSVWPIFLFFIAQHPPQVK